MGALKDRRRILYDTFKAMKDDFTFSKPFSVKFSLKTEGFEILFEDSTRAHLSVHRVTRGYLAGQFGAYSNFGVWGGPTIALVRERLPDASSRFRQEKIVQGTSSSVVPEHPEDYKFVEPADAAELAAELMNDIRAALSRSCRPSRMTTARPSMRFWKDCIGRLNVRSPFVLTLSLLNLTGQMNRAGRLSDVAAADERFYDYHEATNEDPELPAKLIKAFL
ncbi:MAG: hypothetical protein ACRBCS_07385 [Cellvibrionaceae bacterium]